MAKNMTADDTIRILQLAPHPEGGHYRQVYQDVRADGSRGFATSIYFLLRAGERSRWHRFDAAEIWCYHAGSPLELETWSEGGSIERYRLGSDMLAGERPQVTVPANVWMTAATLGDWTLLGCISIPAFEFAGFELAPDNWPGPAC